MSYTPEKNLKDSISKIFNESAIRRMWKDSKYENIKFLSPTKKGTVGELFKENALRDADEHNMYEINVPTGRKGSYDVGIIILRILFEVKTATMGVNRTFQFNAMHEDNDFTHLFCFGVEPNDMCYQIIKKEDLFDKTYMKETFNATLGSLQNKKNNAKERKLTLNKKRMKPISELHSELKGMLKDGEKTKK